MISITGSRRLTVPFARLSSPGVSPSRVSVRRIDHSRVAELMESTDVTLDASETWVGDVETSDSAIV